MRGCGGTWYLCGVEYHTTDHLSITKERRCLYIREVWQSASYNQVIKFILGPHGTVQYYVPAVALQEEADSFTCGIHLSNASSESSGGFRGIFQLVGNTGDREISYKISCENRHIQNMGQSVRQLSWFLPKVCLCQGKQKGRISD